MKKKKYFSTLNLQTDPKASRKTMYELDASCGFTENIETSNPIMTVLLNSVEPGIDDVKLYLIESKGSGKYRSKLSDGTEISAEITSEVVENHRANYMEELEAVKQRAGTFQCEVMPIKLEDDTNKSYMRLARDIMAQIEDGDLIYMDITYGNKPLPIVQFLAMTYAVKIRRNVEICVMSYGSFYGTSIPKPTLINLTSFFLLNNLMTNLPPLEQADKLVDNIIGGLVEDNE